MGDLSKSDIAAKAYQDENFGQFHHPNSSIYEKYYKVDPWHVVVIVGMNNTYQDEKKHYVEIKNTYGEDWGDMGLAVNE